MYAYLHAESVTKQQQHNWRKHLLILLLIWLIGVICDRIWFTLDNSVPAWDQADYLNGVINYWQALQAPQWFNSDWWRDFWLQSSKIPPLTYILTVPWFNLLGVSADAATLVMLLFSAILLLSVYGLGARLFNPRVGLLAALLCQLLPGLYRYRLEFLLDYPVTAIVTFSFGLLTVWKFRTQRRRSFPLVNWIWAIMFGLSFGTALMIKQTSILFLFTPLIWLLFSTLWHKQCLRLLQLLTSFAASLLVFYPWYRTNWFLILTSGKRATIDSAIAEGDPALNSIDAWIYYLKILPYLLSWLLILVSIIGLILYWLRNWLKSKRVFPPFSLSPNYQWLAVFLIGGYLLSSVNINKDARYILPLLPVLSLILAQGLLAWHGRWQKYILWVTIAIATLTMLGNLFPLPGANLSQKLSPRVQHYPYRGGKFPHEQVITEIVQTNPYLHTTLGVLPSTPAINQHNFSFYGSKIKDQVSGRQVGVRKEEVEQDVRSLDWFLTKTGDQGSVPEAQAIIVNQVENDSDFILQKSWQLPDESNLKLYHRSAPNLQVQPLSRPQSQVRLDNISAPLASPPNLPIPVTYKWSGSWEQLQSGLLILTWHQNNKIGNNNRTSWLHDHAIGMGFLKASDLQANDDKKAFQVTEKTAMLPGKDITPGNYTLEATYVNRKTGETYPIAVPSVNIKIEPNATATPAPELDLVTQLRTASANVSQGIAGLLPLFPQITRINQYDPNQDYVVQAQQALEYRLQQQPKRLDWAYNLAITKVLQQNAPGAIATFQDIIPLDSQNPYPYAYLAFVHLYNWQPKAAQKALEPALQLDPNIEELQALDGISALMQGNLIKAWRKLSPLIWE